jgi:hypothetical protein
MNTPPEKRCSACGQLKPCSEFYKNRSTADGLQECCRICHLEAQRRSVLKRKTVSPPPKKRCPRCDRVVLLAGWNKNKASFDGLQVYCKECSHAASSRAYHKRKAADPEWYERQKKACVRRDLRRTLRLHGVDEEAYEALVARGCSICGGLPNGTGRYAFDHDHTTGKFRGLLCSVCNAALGGFKDDVELLMNAAEYLRRHKAQE